MLFIGDKVLFRKLLGNHHIGWHVIQVGCCVFHPCVPVIQGWYLLELTYHQKLEIETGLLIIQTIWSFLISHMFLI